MNLLKMIRRVSLFFMIMRGVYGDGYSDTKTYKNEVASVVGGVLGAIAAIAVVVVVLVLCVRRRSRQKATERGRPEIKAESHSNPYLEENLPDPDYSTADDIDPATNRMPHKLPLTTVASSSSQAGLLDGMFAASSNPYELVDETPQGNGAFCIYPAAGSASLTPVTKNPQAPNPIGDEYAVVNKPRGKKPRKTPPPKPPKPKVLKASSKAADVVAATAGGGDLYAVVDKSRSKGGNAKKSKSDPPSADALQTAAPSPPGVMYTDLEEVRSAARPPAGVVKETEYSTIDHVATANLANDA